MPEGMIFYFLPGPRTFPQEQHKRNFRSPRSDLGFFLDLELLDPGGVKGPEIPQEGR